MQRIEVHMHGLIAMEDRLLFSAALNCFLSVTISLQSEKSVIGQLPGKALGQMTYSVGRRCAILAGVICLQ
jgi:hypothetical protein